MPAELYVATDDRRAELREPLLVCCGILPHWANVAAGRRRQRTDGPAANAHGAEIPAAAGKVFFGRSLPGDWVCPSCGDHQFRRNDKCRKCQAVKPAAGSATWEDGDWGCPCCGDHQFARNAACRKCGTPSQTPTMGYC